MYCTFYCYLLFELHYNNCYFIIFSYFYDKLHTKPEINLISLFYENKMYIYVKKILGLQVQMKAFLLNYGITFKIDLMKILVFWDTLKWTWNEWEYNLKPSFNDMVKIQHSVTYSVFLKKTVELNFCEKIIPHIFTVILFFNVCK